MSYAVGFLGGFLLYHFLMNRAIMMRECCIKHFQTHPTCPCRDCEIDRMLEEANRESHPIL